MEETAAAAVTAQLCRVCRAGGVRVLPATVSEVVAVAVVGAAGVGVMAAVMAKERWCPYPAPA